MVYASERVTTHTPEAWHAWSWEGTLQAAVCSGWFYDHHIQSIWGVLLPSLLSWLFSTSPHLYMLVWCGESGGEQLLTTPIPCLTRDNQRAHSRRTAEKATLIHCRWQHPDKPWRGAIFVLRNHGHAYKAKEDMLTESKAIRLTHSSRNNAYPTLSAVRSLVPSSAAANCASLRFYAVSGPPRVVEIAALHHLAPALHQLLDRWCGKPPCCRQPSARTWTYSSAAGGRSQGMATGTNSMVSPSPTSTASRDESHRTW